MGNSVMDFLGFGNPYDGAQGVTMPNQGAYQPNLGGTNAALAQLQQYAQQPGVVANQANSLQDRAQQQALIDLLMGRANGTAGPSVAQQQMAQGLDRAVAQGRSVAQSVAAANPIAALQAAGGAQSLMQRQSLNDAAQLRAQEQLNATNQVGSTLSQQRYGDVTDTAQQLEAAQQNNALHSSLLNSILSGNLQSAQMQQTGSINYANALMNQQNMARQASIDARAADMNARRSFFSTILQTVGTLGAGALTGGLSGAAGGALGGAAGGVAKGAMQGLSGGGIRLGIQ